MEQRFQQYFSYIIAISSLLYPPQTKFGGYIGITLSVCPSVHVPCKRNSSLTTYWIFMTLYLQYTTCRCAWRNMVAVQNLKGEMIQLILSRKGGGMYLVSATPPKRLIGFLWNFTHLKYTTCRCARRNMVAVQNLKGEIIQLILSRKGWGNVPCKRNSY
jgi:hypothetical protein